MTVPQPIDDPWAVDHDLARRIALARSILGHATPTDGKTQRAVDNALRALAGETIDEIRTVTP